MVELAERFRRAKRKDISRDHTALMKLLEATLIAVGELQHRESTELHVPYIASDGTGPLHFRTQLTREDALCVADVREIEQLLD